ncbi:hypothetical protein RJZ56_002371 [Blastomyces dermatitidis]|uniref:Uncharacterized protein n=3 Tax=Blastomyces TaxID=229219 RepID=A0A179UUR0_BLAGS|nr:uncharacterized protein BDBG_06606 [Blastomyces gilchristii SLH14081]XP_045277539.1 uncharacterized protein BDCG_06011 [Blastomyces dermatitidis ER-3]EGE78769.1 hypothetical protein BDDG_01706 [Blastomyces dermatitidis ATCC 18188]EQL36475.1 hypothetical protein BDFG_01870 [Blastomyces dermatitidis ATCC 26199]EEQ90891.1 hypothetical protein BDCG_06011 [Blastomyces dermatitidis ER-3]OAT10817.1 hypothetical protein BDBG_06606 [Blastomyces gilchristii SLH14081]
MDTFEGLVILLVIVLIFTPTPMTQVWHWLAVQFGWEWLRPHPPPPEYVAPLLDELRGIRNDLDIQLVPVLGLFRQRLELGGQDAGFERSGGAGADAGADVGEMV